MPSSRKKTVSRAIIALVATILIVGGFSSCDKKPELKEVSDIKIIGIKNDQLLLSLVCNFHNPAPVKVVLTDSDFRIDFEDQQLASFEFEDKVKFPARGDQDIQMEASLNLKKLAKSQKSLLSKETQELRIEGDVKYDLIGIPLGTSIEQGFEFNYHDEMQSFLSDRFGTQGDSSSKSFLKSFRLGEESSFSKVHLVTNLEIINDQGVDINVENMKLEMRLDSNRSAIATWEQNERLEFDSYDTLQVPVDIEINTFKLATGSGKLLKKDGEKIKLYIRGEINLELARYKYRIPLAFTQEVDPKIISKLL